MRGTVSTWSYTHRWSYPSASARRATVLAVAQAVAASRPDSSSFQPCGTNAPHRRPAMAGTYQRTDHPRIAAQCALDRSGMTVLATEVRQLLGSEVDVDT